MDRHAFTRALDSVPTGLVFFNRAGRIVQANCAGQRLLEVPENDRLRVALHEFVSQLNLLLERTPVAEDEVRELATREVETPSGLLYLRGSYIGIDLFGEGGMLLISAERWIGKPLPDEVLRDRFHLTRQEVRIARLLGEGRSNAAIAAEMTISPHTARTHTERVLRKLGVRSRAEVGARIQRG